MQESIATAKAWILIDAESQVYIRGHNTHIKREIASLTKMFTLYACLTLNKILKINPKSTLVQTFQTSVLGTSAELAPNQYITIQDLYYGLMLPSGNDAACILSYYYGSWLSTLSKEGGPPKILRKQTTKGNLSHYNLFNKKFVQYMNNVIVKEQLKLKHTNFQNAHGLADKNQVSSAQQIAAASLVFMKHQEFEKIAKCPFYRGYYHESQLAFQWQNTNILLKQGYKGIKTGYTSTAGGCLASLTSISLGKYSSQQLLIIVLGSTDAQSRFEDTKKIVSHHQTYLKMMKL